MTSPVDDILGPEDLPGALARAGRVDLVVGVRSLDSGRTIGPVMTAVCAGLSSYYPAGRHMVVLADGGSRDGTLEQARRAAGAVPLLVVRHRPGALETLAPGGAGGSTGDRGNDLLTVLRVTEGLGAAGCALVDGDVPTVAPEWVRDLLEPVVHDGLDLVAPVYARHRYDGLVTSGLLGPLTRALYGRRVRQPVGGHFGLSGGLARRLLRGGAWERRAAGFARDVWMVTVAIADGLRVGQVRLGAGRRAGAGAGAELGARFAQVVGTAFTLMEDYRPVWWSVVESQPVPSYGPTDTPGVEPVSVNVDRMVSTFRQGVAELMPLWQRALAPDTCAAVAALAADGGREHCFPDDLWARVVYDVAVAHHGRLLPRRQLLRALLPLYLGRAAAFVLRTQDGGAAETEADLDALGESFESEKPYLLDRWDTGGRRQSGGTDR